MIAKNSHNLQFFLNISDNQIYRLKNQLKMDEIRM